MNGCAKHFRLMFGESCPIRHTNQPVKLPFFCRNLTARRIPVLDWGHVDYMLPELTFSGFACW